MKMRNLFKLIVASIVLCGLLMNTEPFSTIPTVEAGNAAIVADQFPPDMPNTPFPELKGCSPNQEAYLKKAWRQAHYYTWRADKLMDYIISHDESQRDDLWNRDFVEGNTIVPSPRRWFGVYNRDRAIKVRDAIDKARKRFEQKGEIVKGIRTLRCGQPIAPAADQHTDVCPGSNIGAEGPPGGYHAPVGVIVTCPPFWDTANNNFRFPDERLDLSARMLTHEIFHWLSVDGKYVTDLHGGLQAKDKYYGQTKSLSLAEDKPDWAIYNNDNYAWFINFVGRHEPSYSAVWGEKDAGGVGGFFADLSWSELVKRWTELTPNQYLSDVETYVRDGERKYMAVWRVGKGSGDLWASEWDAFGKKWNELKKTQDLVDIEIYKSGDKWMYLGVYKVKAAGAVGDGGLLIDLSWDDLVAKWKQFTDVAYLADVETYVEGGKRKFIGVWLAGKGNGALSWQKDHDDFVNLKKQLNPTQQLIDFEKFNSADGKWNYLGLWHVGKSGGPLHQRMTLAELFAKRNELKASHTLLKVEEYSALPARIK